jgi:photosystem II stability/assembly factor-like uncharacterized protein
MKNSLIVLLYTLVSLPVSAQWIEQSSPTTKTLYSVSVADNSVAWACGREGTILKTTDGGTNWNIATTYFLDYQHLWSIYALDDQTAWVDYTQLGGIGDITEIYKTTDGGSTWNLTFEQTGGWIMDIQMFTPDDGFLYTSPLNQYWRFFNTTNGGTSWQLITEYQEAILNEDGHFNSTFFSGSDIWFGSNSTNIYHSSDNGNNWSHIPVTTQNIYSIWFNNADYGLAACDLHLQRTTDGGNTWGTTGTPTLDSSSSIYGENNSWWLANQNHIYYSDNNAIGWTTQYSAPSGRYFQISKARNGNLLLAVRSNGGISAYMLPVPVELSSFTAKNDLDNVSLNWETATERNNKGFILHRSKIITNSDGYEKTKYAEIAFVEGNGTTTNKNNYSYTDKNLIEGIYSYRLIQIDFDGTQNKIGEINVKVENQVKDYLLAQNYPNPFNPTTEIKYTIPEKSFVTLKIYDILGNEITELVNGEKIAGHYSVQFNSMGLASGIYFYKMEAGNFIATKKVIIMK